MFTQFSKKKILYTNFKHSRILKGGLTVFSSVLEPYATLISQLELLFNLAASLKSETVLYRIFCLERVHDIKCTIQVINFSSISHHCRLFEVFVHFPFFTRSKSRKTDLFKFYQSFQSEQF